MPEALWFRWQLALGVYWRHLRATMGAKHLLTRELLAEISASSSRGAPTPDRNLEAARLGETFGGWLSCHILI